MNYVVAQLVYINAYAFTWTLSCSTHYRCPRRVSYKAVETIMELHTGLIVMNSWYGFLHFSFSVSVNQFMHLMGGREEILASSC